MGHVAVTEELPGSDELDRLYRLDATETEPEDDEDEDDEDEDEDEDKGGGDEGAQPEGMPHG
jgi:hypothetical protein